MSQFQPWPISQDANKRKGICSVCFATRQLKNNDGTVHLHGPRNNRCMGSDKPPSSVVGTTCPSVGLNSTSSVQASTATSIEIPASSLTAPTAVDVPNVHSCLNQHNWFQPTSHQLIKHIPKSARPTCSLQLAELLSAIVTRPDDTSVWHSLMMWPSFILKPVIRGGKKHNIATVIKKRVAAFTSPRCETDLPTWSTTENLAKDYSLH